jgi:hypothetical protein
VTPVKASLKRGALVAAANWHVVIVQFVADVVFKTLLAVPIVGGVFLVVLMVGGDPSELLAQPVGEILPSMATVLLAQPLALAAFLLAVATAVSGGSLFMFLVKGGTVTVLIAAERAAGTIEHPPLRLAAVRRATQFSLERFTGGAEHLFRRYLTLGVGLMLVYLATTVVSISIMLGPLREASSWRTLAAGVSLLLVGWITVVNFLYLLLQIVTAADDCSVRVAVSRVVGLLRTQGKTMWTIFGATLVVVTLTTAASILATAALGLIAFVPFVSLAALPLQLIAWLLRGAVFQYIGLTALVAYLRVYRLSREGLAPATASGGVSQIGRTA